MRLWVAMGVVLTVALVWWLVETEVIDLGPLTGFVASAERSPLLKFEGVTGRYLLYTVPIGAAVVVVARMVIGLKSFGLFTPMLMAMAFLQTGPIVGPIILALAIGAGLIMAPILKQLKMARVGFLAGLLAVVTILLIAIMPFLRSASWVTAFPVLVTVLAVERWWVVWEGEGLWDAFKIAVSTMFIAIVIEVVVLSSPVATLVSYSPMVAAVTGGVISIAAGLYRGLRLTELTRFAAVRSES